MQPTIEIRCMGPSFFTYAVRAGQALDLHGEVMLSLDSLAQCLNDAGDSLDGYFRSVQVSLDGEDLGSYATERLLHNAAGLASELMGKADRARALRAMLRRGAPI